MHVICLGYAVIKYYINITLFYYSVYHYNKNYQSLQKFNIFLFYFFC